MLARTLLALIALAAVIMAGCEKEEPPPPPPPLPSEGQIYQGLREAMNIILVRGGPTEEETTQSINRLQQALNENLADPTLYSEEEITRYQEARKNARRSIQRDIEERLRTSRDLGGWRIVLGCALAYEVLKPGDDRYADEKEKALKMINKPRITAKGSLSTGDNYTRVTLEISDPVSGQTVTEHVREGQYFYNNRFRLLEIIGNNMEYRIEYTDVNDHIFTVESADR